jgi:hypothetical protein
MSHSAVYVSPRAALTQTAEVRYISSQVGGCTSTSTAQNLDSLALRLGKKAKAKQIMDQRGIEL